MREKSSKYLADTNESPVIGKWAKRLSVGAAAAVVAASAGAYGFNRAGNELEQERLAADTSIYEGESKIEKVVPLDNIEVMGYEAKYTNIRVAREIDAVVDLNKLNPFDDTKNRIIATVDVSTESTLKINPEQLSQVEVEVDEDNRLIEVEMSRQNLLVESHQKRDSLTFDINPEGANTKIKDAHDVFKENDYLDEDKNAVLTLAVDVALHQSDNRSNEVVEANLDALDNRLEEVIIDYLDLKDQGYEVKVVWLDDGTQAEIVGQEEHEAAIRELGGEEILSEGDVSVKLPDASGGM